MVERLIEVYNHQEVIPVSEELLSDLGLLAKKALPLAIEVKIEGDRCVLPELVELEFSLVDNETIAKVHDDFMEIPSATDVITFDHGEVIIGLEVAICNFASAERQKNEIRNQSLPHAKRMDLILFDGK